MPIRKIIEIDEDKCTGCGQCVPACAEGAIEIIGGKAKVVKDMYCDGLGACLGHCPEDALKIIEREAEPFDEEAAMEYVRQKQAEQNQAPAGGCPGAALADFTAQSAPAGCPGSGLAAFTIENAAAAPQVASPSSLGHWPVKIRLMPVDAPALQGANLVIAADCAAVAHPDFHKRFVPGAVVLIGCPKFDLDADYPGRFTGLFSSVRPNSVTVVRMEVPCCGGLPHAVKQGLAASGANIPYREIVIGRRGETRDAAHDAARGIA